MHQDDYICSKLQSRTWASLPTAIPGVGFTFQSQLTDILPVAWLRAPHLKLFWKSQLCLSGPLDQRLIILRHCLFVQNGNIKYITKLGDKQKGHFKYNRVCLGIGPMWKDLNRCIYAFTSPAHASMPFYFSKALRGSCSPGENSRATMDLQQQWLQGFCYCLCCCSCSCCLFLLFLFFLWFLSVVSVSYDLGCSTTQ